MLRCGSSCSPAAAARVRSRPRWSGCRGSMLTLAINGYDDGASTGEVRRFLGDALGPSDFRKNASRLATALASCAPALVRLLDRRLPAGRHGRDGRGADGRPVRRRPVDADVATIDADRADRASPSACRRFSTSTCARGRAFRFDDCARRQPGVRGRLPACRASFQRCGGRLRRARRRRPGVIENVTDGSNAFLVAIDRDGRVLGQRGRHRRRDTAERDRGHLPAWPARSTPRNAPRSRRAGRDGTRPHGSRPCSVRSAAEPAARGADCGGGSARFTRRARSTRACFPSYLTPGLTQAIAANVRAIKLLITNIQADAEIAGSSAVDIVGRAVHYLKEKGRHADADARAHHTFPDERARTVRHPRCRTCRSAVSTRCRIRGSCGSDSTRRA